MNNALHIETQSGNPSYYLILPKNKKKTTKIMHQAKIKTILIKFKIWLVLIKKEKDF
jgi:hypothetical protein